MKISVLDCTLRDGGYINNWKFPLNQIIRLLESLDKSNVDIVELGYLNDKSEQDIDSTLFESIEHINSNFKGLLTTAKVVVMINLFDFDFDKLAPRKDSIVDGIRLAFHKKDIDEAYVSNIQIENDGKGNVTATNNEGYFDPDRMHSFWGRFIDFGRPEVFDFVFRDAEPCQNFVGLLAPFRGRHGKAARRAAEGEGLGHHPGFAEARGVDRLGDS